MDARGSGYHTGIRFVGAADGGDAVAVQPPARNGGVGGHEGAGKRVGNLGLTGQGKQQKAKTEYDVFHEAKSKGRGMGLQ
ncbi:hypothetical protein GCM10022406_07810 [Hymenobacter algoricola]|uniref:Uncharacterized protein n=1 Tax=Hymenobacter algoricola TaxID=486267 RepID=A0ABP7MIU5_9BACT